MSVNFTKSDLELIRTGNTLASNLKELLKLLGDNDDFSTHERSEIFYTVNQAERWLELIRNKDFASAIRESVRPLAAEIRRALSQ